MKILRLVLPMLVVFSLVLSSCNSSLNPKKEPDATSKPITLQSKIPSTTEPLSTPAVIDEKDYTILPFALNMTFKKFKNVIINNPIISSKTENADALEIGAHITTYKLEDGTLISFWQYKDENIISAIEIISDKYLTPRGLKVGDSINTLRRLYGKADNINKGEYSFDDGYGYDFFTVTIQDYKVYKIRVNLMC